MSTSTTVHLSRRSSSPSEKHAPTLRFFQEVPAQQHEGITPGQSRFSLAKHSVPTAHVDQSGNMASRLAHDLVNILTTIQGNTELIALQLLDLSSQQRCLFNIVSASQRGHQILEQLLSGTPHQHAFLEELDLRVLVEEVLGGLHAVLPATITIKLVDRLPTGKMMGQSTQLFRMLSNLVSNAVRAMDRQKRGTLTIILDLLRQTDPVPFPKRITSSYMRVMVRDTGTGMSADRCREIFTPYFTTHQDGTGLGLAIVKEVVNDHGGVVTVDSQPGQGSTFAVYLPIYQQVHPQVAPAKQAAS